MSDTIVKKRRARLGITSSHRVLEPEKMGKYSSLFADPAEFDDDGEISPEDYPEEMNDVLREMGAQNGELIEEDEDGLLAEMFRRIEEYSKNMVEEDPYANAFEFCTEAEIRETEGGVIEIEYVEDESMDGTTTVIVYDPKNPATVSILHNGSVMSSLICERKRRHISVYTTPIMPFEVAVYTRLLEGGFDIERGGEMELDYIVELRGMDIQRTMMKIRADITD